jgi:hypothetical protein
MAAPELIATNDIYQPSVDLSTKNQPTPCSRPGQVLFPHGAQIPLANDALRAMSGWLVPISPSHRLP